MSKKIGIIGGAGVAATNKLLELIENEITQNGAYRDCHHPEILIWQATQAPSRSMYLEGKGESFIPHYIDIAKKMKACGIDTICMCCNTAHYAIDKIAKDASINMINLVEAVVNEAKKIGKTQIGLIASDGCLKGKVYEQYFSKLYPEATLIYPDKARQKLVTKGICNIKNINRFSTDNTERPKYIFKKIKEHLKQNGAHIVITGCTDIRVDYNEEENIDSLEILKNEILKEIYE